MNIRAMAKADNKAILNDGASGFGCPIILTSPEEVSVPLTGFSNDIAQIIDPDTGTAVSGRLISAVLHTQDILDAGLVIPRGISDGAKKPWLVAFADINGVEATYKVRNSNPDRALGEVSLILQVYDTNGV